MISKYNKALLITTDESLKMKPFPGRSLDEMFNLKTKYSNKNLQNNAKTLL